VKKEGSQFSLSYNNDREIRRITIKSHLCGVAVAYEPFTHRRNDENTRPGRPQGSHYSQQKRQIADACEWIRIHSKYKPRIFVATSPGFTDHANEKNFISKFTHNLRNGYDCQNYVWVREFTQAGFPHFHFVADMPEFNPVDLSLYWSGLFDSEAKNSIRLGTAPNKEGKRIFYLRGGRMCWYMTKYFGKSIGNEERGAIEGKRSFRTFGISQQANKESQPLIFEEQIQRMQTYEPNKGWGRSFSQRSWTLNEDQAEAYYNNEVAPPLFNPKLKRWSWTGHGNTFIGRPKNWTVK
jgi:hypothetical protein